MVPAGEPGHGDDVADDGGGDDRPDAEHLGEAGAGCRDRGGQLLVDLAPLVVQVADAGQQLGGEFAARLGHRTGRGQLLEDPGGLARGDLVRHPAWNQLTQHGMEPAGDLVAGPGKITMALGPHLQHDGVAIGGHLLAALGPQRRHRHRPGIVGVGLVRVAGLQQPDPGSQLGLHIATRSPAATSCWASSRPSPRAPSTAQVRSGQACAQATSFTAWSGQARTRSLPSGSSAAPTATAVCEPLCGSIPIITAISATPILTSH